jgi:choline dehydrogenase
LLCEHGINVVHELPGVGENLQDHLQIRAVYKVQNAKTLNERANSLIGKASMGLEYLLFKRGPMTMAPSQLGVFTKSDDSREMPNLQYHVQPLSLDQFGEPLHSFPAITASVCNLRPDSRGHIRIKSRDPRAKPSIRPNYLSVESDRQIAANALKLTRRIVAAPAMEKYAPEEYLPGPQVASDEDLARAAGDIATTIFHPVGTCKMGSDDMAVVDDRLRLHGLKGLRIADASIMPTITSGNTNSPTIMIAEKAAVMMKEDRVTR